MSAARWAASLRGVPLLAGVPQETVDRLAERTSQHRLEAGEWLFHEGDPGDSLFVVTAGSIDVIAEHPIPTVVRRMGRGESIGELALLIGAPRSLGARAHRDCELLRVAREDFDRLLLEQPAFGLALTRELGTRLREVRSPLNATERSPRTIALIPLHAGAPIAAVADGLSASLQRLGRLARLEGGEALPLETLDRLESAHDRVLLVATSDTADDPWRAYCLRQSDRVIGVAARPPNRGWRAIEPRLTGCDLAFLAATGVEPDLARWMDALDPRATHILRDGGADGVARMARRLAGQSLGVVLSGGGARGFAHVGVVEELQRSGYVVDRIGGASMGAMVGSLFAEGRTADDVTAVLEAEYVQDSPMRGRTVPLVSLSRGVHGFAMQHRIHGTRCIEGLDVDFFCVSSDLAAQRLVVHRRGLVAVAVSASQALPAFVPPVKDGDRMLVDGAVLNNLPVEPMAMMGEGPVIAVDVSGRLPPPRPHTSRVPFLFDWIVGPAAEWAPPLAETLLRSILLGNVQTDAAARERADLVIAPTLKGVSTMRFRDLEGVRRLGREATRQAIEAGRLESLGLPRST